MRSYTTLVPASLCSVREAYVFEVRHDKYESSSLVSHIVEGDFEDSFDCFGESRIRPTKSLRWPKSIALEASQIPGYRVKKGCSW